MTPERFRECRWSADALRSSPSSMSSPHRGPVLVTGVPYSGTTWMGLQLRDACDLAYLQEPLSPSSDLAGYERRFRHHHAFLTDRNAAEHLPSLRRLAAMRPRIRWRNLLLDRSLLAREIREHQQRRADRLAGRRPLWKDPIALLSSGWIARNLDAAVLLMVRHPLAFVASVLHRAVPTYAVRTGMESLLHDAEFMRVHGPIAQEDLMRMHHPQTSPVEQVALTWRVSMSVALRELMPVQEQVIVARYEDCLARPVDLLTRLAGGLGLPIVMSPSAVVAMHRGVHAHRTGPLGFDATADADRWRVSLGDRDQSLVRGITRPLASIWYDADQSNERGLRGWTAKVA